MDRRISVLYVGTSVVHDSAAQHALAVQGVDVFFDSAGGQYVQLTENHDVIAFDAPAGEPGIVLVDGRRDPERRRQLRVADLAGLPAAITELLESGALASDTDAHAGDSPASLAELRELIAGLPGVLFRCGIDGAARVSFLGAQVQELCGYRPSHFRGHRAERLLALVHPADRRRTLRIVQRALRNREPFSFEHRIHCADGSEKWLWHRGQVHGRGGMPELESFVVDITQRKCEEQQLAWLANHDALTGVANRGMFLEQMSKSVQRADRHGEMIACLFIDLDRFKHINDSFGHASGDELLRQVSERLKRCIRGNDMVGRLGGDEFTVLLDGIAEPQDAATAATKILDELVRPYDIRDRRFTISASIGISCYPGDANDSASLLRNADIAMYNVKSRGRRGYRFFSPEITSQAFETLALSNALRGAIESGQLVVHYQPRVELRTGRVSALEVLARWNSPEFGNVAPARFVALAEEAGLIGMLGDHVLASACRQLLAWDREGLSCGRISVNISAHQFRDEHLAERISAALAGAGLGAERLELEVTEETMMQDTAATADILRRLKEIGVKLSIDDFGTGFTALHLLKKFSLDYLKVDRSFIRGVPHSADDVALTEAIIAMAKRLNLGVVAEGIETEAQGIFVRASGCDEGQGYLFSRPAAEAEIRQYLQRRVH